MWPPRFLSRFRAFPIKKKKDFALSTKRRHRAERVIIDLLKLSVAFMPSTSSSTTRASCRIWHYSCASTCVNDDDTGWIEAGGSCTDRPGPPPPPPIIVQQCGDMDGSRSRKAGAARGAREEEGRTGPRENSPCVGGSAWGRTGRWGCRGRSGWHGRGRRGALADDGHRRAQNCSIGFSQMGRMFGRLVG